MNTVGETATDVVVAPVLHEYVVAPLAVKLAEAPAQMVALLTATVGLGLATTEVVLVFEQPNEVPVTV